MIDAVKILKNDLRKINLDQETSSYLEHRINAAKKEIEREGIKIDMNEIDHVLIVVDYAAWLYKKRDQDVDFPRNLRFRMNNLLYEQKGRVNK